MDFYRIDGILLKNEFKPNGAVFFVLKGGDTEKIHNDFVEKNKEKLLSENYSNHSSWIFTDKIFKNIGGITPYLTVISFKVKDIW